jgi:hypothetical protein
MADATCVVDGCPSGQKIKMFGLCGKHYQRLRNTGTTDERVKTPPPPKPCSVEGCTHRVRSRDLCNKHYQRWTAHGSTEKPARGLATCTLDGCERPHVARGWCAQHYAAWAEYGVPIRPTREAQSCSVGGCDRKHKAYGLCELHLRRHRAGTPLDRPVQLGKSACSRDRCNDLAASRGLCRRHYYDAFMRPRRHIYRANARVKWLAKSPEVRSKERADYYRKNREHIRAKRKLSYDEVYSYDPAPWRAARARRRARTKYKMTATDRKVSLAYRRIIATDPCRYCGNPAATAVDHYFPLAKGGTDLWFNLTSSCTECNASKHAKCGTLFALRKGPEVLARVFPSTFAA